jgi:YbbR domain-containing protein
MPPPGYRVETTTIVPPTVAISGPASAVQSVDEIDTEPVDVTGITGSVQRQVALVPREDSIAFKPERVTVQLTVSQIVVQRDFDRVPVEVRNVDRPFQLRPSRVNVTVRGPERVVRGLELGDGSIYVDGAPFDSGEHEVHPQVTLPPEVELVKAEPTALKLRIVSDGKKTDERKGPRT